MSLLSAHDIEKSYGAHRVLAGVTATLASGERVGLVGNNGSGKSTLVRVLAKVDTPDVGVVMQRRGSRTGYLPQLPELYQAIRRPVRIGWGVHDPHFPRSQAERLAALVPDAQLALIPGAGHWPQWTHADDVVALTEAPWTW